MEKQNNDFLGTEPLGPLLRRLALPTVAAQLINMLYNIVDRMYIGHIPKTGAMALTGLGVCMPIIMIVSAFAADVSLGAAVLVVTAIATLTAKYLYLGAVIGALSYIVLGILIVDDSLILRLAIFTSALVIFKHLPALTRVLNRTEPKLDFSDDITYKLDE